MHQKIVNIIKKVKNNKPLLFIVVFYLCLVFFNFFKQGLVNWDEAYFMVVVNTFSDIIRTGLSDTASLFSGEYYQELIKNYGNIYTAARPSYIVPAIFINLIFPSEFSTRLLSLIAGLISIIYFYRTLKFFKFNKSIKLASTLLLASSPLFLTYSRIGLSQILSATFLLISIYYLLQFSTYQKTKALKLSAIFLSLLLMSHYNTIFLVAFLLLATLIILIQHKVSFKKYILYALYFSVIPLAWEAVTRLGLLIANLKQINTAGQQVIYSYFQEFTNQLGLAGGDGGFVFDQIFYYDKLILSTESLIVMLLMIMGLFVFSKNIEKKEYLIVLVPTLLHFAMFSLVSLKFPRNIVTVLPLLYIFVALGIGYIYNKFKNQQVKKWSLAIICLAVIILHGWQYKNYLNIQTNFQQIKTFIQENYEEDNTVILSSSAPIWRIYLPGWKVENVREINTWKESLEQKELLFISDYFIDVKPDDAKNIDNFSTEIVKEVPTNIFQVEAVILDFIYQSEEENQKMFEQNKNNEIKVRQLAK